MLQTINEIFDTSLEGAGYKLIDKKIESSAQTFDIEGETGSYRIKFLNANKMGKYAQTMLVGQITADMKKFKPLIKKIAEPLKFFSALRAILTMHAYSADPKPHHGFILVVQKNSFSIPIPTVQTIVGKALRAGFRVLSPGMPLAPEDIGINLKPEDFETILICKKTYTASKIFTGTPTSEVEPTKTTKLVANEPAPAASKTVDHSNGKADTAATAVDMKWVFSLLMFENSLAKTSNFGFFKNGILHNADGEAIPNMPFSVYENIVFASASDFIKAHNAIHLNPKYKQLVLLATATKAVKANGTATYAMVKEGFESNHANSVSKPMTSQQFLDIFETDIKFRVNFSTAYGFNEIYKLRVGVSEVEHLNPIYDASKKATSSAATSSATTSTPAGPVTKKFGVDTSKLSVPKKGVANGLQTKSGAGHALSLSPETIAWLSANPPAKLNTPPVEWKSFQTNFKPLDMSTIEVNGFDIKFNSSEPEKLFKQLTNFEKMATQDQLDSLKNQISDALGYKEQSNAKMLRQLQAAHFPDSSAIKQYTGSFYDEMNKALRGQSSDSSTESRIRQADKYFAMHGKALPASVIVYRGQSIMLSEIAGLLEGNEYVMHSYVSTSLNLSTANGFMKSYVQMSGKHFVVSGEAKHILKSPADVSLVDSDLTRKIRCMLVISGLDKTLNVAPGSWGQHEGECEIILNRGTRLGIDKTLPIKVFVSNDYTDKKLNTSALIYCTIVGDGPIDYGLNEQEYTMTNEQVANSGKNFSDKVKSEEKRKAAETEFALKDLKKQETRPEEPGDRRWSDDVFG